MVACGGKCQGRSLREVVKGGSPSACFGQNHEEIFRHETGRPSHYREQKNAIFNPCKHSSTAYAQPAIDCIKNVAG
eukprot:1151414-Pelagomonas_calceolata.AAC.4